MKNFTPNELKALWYYYGDARTAAKKLGIGTGTLIENATVDIKGRERQLSEKTKTAINKVYGKLKPSEKGKITRLANRLDEYPQEAIQKKILKTNPTERKKLFREFDKEILELGNKGEAWLVFRMYLKEG